MPSTLPMCPPEAVSIGNSCFAVLISDDTFTYFSNLIPFDSHAADDRTAMLLRIGRLAAISAVSPQELADAFAVSRATVQRARRRYLAEGEAGFMKPRRGRGPSVFTPELAEKATALLASGLSGSAAARVLGVSAPSVNKWRRQGLIGNTEADGEPGRSALAAPPDAGAAPEGRVDEESTGAPGPETAPGLEAQPQTDRSARDRRDRQAPMGRATCDVPARVLASCGLLRVHILGLANDACDRWIDAVLSDLNATETVFPGTRLRIVYDIDGASESARLVSPKISRDQEV